MSRQSDNGVEDGTPDPFVLYDPRNLIVEAYRIEGITLADCRTIFLDWVLGLGADQSAPDAIRAMLTHDRAVPDHPMTRVLRDALAETPVPGRRGGARGRRG